MALIGFLQCVMSCYNYHERGDYGTEASTYFVNYVYKKETKWFWIKTVALIISNITMRKLFPLNIEYRLPQEFVLIE